MVVWGDSVRRNEFATNGEFTPVGGWFRNVIWRGEFGPWFLFGGFGLCQPKQNTSDPTQPKRDNKKRSGLGQGGGGHMFMTIEDWGDSWGREVFLFDGSGGTRSIIRGNLIHGNVDEIARPTSQPHAETPKTRNVHIIKERQRMRQGSKRESEDTCSLVLGSGW